MPCQAEHETVQPVGRADFVLHGELKHLARAHLAVFPEAVLRVQLERIKGVEQQVRIVVLGFLNRLSAGHEGEDVARAMGRDPDCPVRTDRDVQRVGTGRGLECVVAFDVGPVERRAAILGQVHMDDLLIEADSEKIAIIDLHVLGVDPFEVLIDHDAIGRAIVQHQRVVDWPAADLRLDVEAGQR